LSSRLASGCFACLSVWFCFMYIHPTSCVCSHA
jgi:hypothetical protein